MSDSVSDPKEDPHMLRPMLFGKIHRAKVTQADLHYVGSLTVDLDLLDAAGLVSGQQVDVVDVTNGSRLTTYVLPGERGSGVICVNGAAAHLVHPDDIVIIIAYAMMDETEVASYEPNIVFVDENNAIVDLGHDPGQAPTDSGLLTSAIPTT